MKLDLSTYQITQKQHVRNSETKQLELKDVDVSMDPKAILYDLMRAPGVFKSGPEVVEAVIIARSIRDAGDEIELDEKDFNIVKKVVDFFIAKEHKPEKGIMALGGPEYEELIMRIYA